MDVAAPRVLDSQLGSEEPSEEPLEVDVGRQIAGKYVLTRRIGWGSMGEVWSATHITLGKDVAIKLVRRDAQHGDGLPSTVRFRLEAQIAAQLSRKTRHIVSATDHGEDGPFAYLVMELLAGESLDARLARTGPMPIAKVVPLVYQIARALTVAHGDGVIHRDLKPSNIFVTVDEQGKALLKILDFGIAKASASLGKIAIGIAGAAPLRPPKHATVAGLLLGTPAYMSPEQASGTAVDARADVWALAVMAYQLLADELPFDGVSLQDLLAQIARVDPMPLAFYRPDLPDAVLDLFDRAFAVQLDERFATAASFAAALEQAASARLASAAGAAAPTPMGAITVPPPKVLAAAFETSPEPAPRVAMRAQESPPPEPVFADTAEVVAGLPQWPSFGGRAVRRATLAGSLLGIAFAFWVLTSSDDALVAQPLPRHYAASATLAAGRRPNGAAAVPDVPSSIGAEPPAADSIPSPIPPRDPPLAAVPRLAQARVELPSLRLGAGVITAVAAAPSPTTASGAAPAPDVGAEVPRSPAAGRPIDRAEVF